MCPCLITSSGILLCLSTYRSLDMKYFRFANVSIPVYKTSRPSFCLILKHFHALDDLSSVLSRLHGRKYISAFC